MADVKLKTLVIAQLGHGMVHIIEHVYFIGATLENGKIAIDLMDRYEKDMPKIYNVIGFTMFDEE